MSGMNCSESEQLFDAFLDRELVGTLRVEFDAHRLRCGYCQQKLALLEACEFVISRDERAPALSTDFTARVMGQIASERLAPRVDRRSRVIRLTATLLPLAAAIGLAFVWPRESAQPPTPVADTLDQIIQEKDAVALNEYIWDGVFERLRMAGVNLANDVAGARNVAMNINLADDTPDPTTLNPFDGILRGLVPMADPARASDSETEQFPL